MKCTNLGKSLSKDENQTFFKSGYGFSLALWHSGGMPFRPVSCHCREIRQSLSDLTEVSNLIQAAEQNGFNYRITVGLKWLN